MASVSKEVSLIEQHFDPIATSVEKAGVIDPRVRGVVTKYLAGPVNNVLDRTLFMDRSLLSRTRQLRLNSPEILTLERAWQDYNNQKAEGSLQADNPNNESVINAENFAGLLGSGFRNLYAATAYTQTLTGFLHSGKTVADAERYTNALVDYLSGKGKPVERQQRGGFVGYIRSLFDSGPKPIDMLFELASATGNVANQSELLHTIVSKMAVTAYTIVEARKELQNAEGHVQKTVTAEVSQPNSAIQSIGRRLVVLESRLDQLEQERRSVSGELSSLLGTERMTEQQMRLSQRLRDIDIAVTQLQIQQNVLRGQIDTEISLLLAADGRVDLQTSGLRSIRRNIDGLLKSALFSNYVLLRTIGDTYSALVDTSLVEGRATQAMILHNYQESIKQIPAQITQDIEESVRVALSVRRQTTQIAIEKAPAGEK